MKCITHTSVTGGLYYCNYGDLYRSPVRTHADHHGVKWHNVPHTDRQLNITNAITESYQNWIQMRLQLWTASRTRTRSDGFPYRLPVPLLRFLLPHFQRPRRPTVLSHISDMKMKLIFCANTLDLRSGSILITFCQIVRFSFGPVATAWNEGYVLHGFIDAIH